MPLDVVRENPLVIFLHFGELIHSRLYEAFERCGAQWLGHRSLGSDVATALPGERCTANWAALRPGAGASELL